MAGTRRGCDRLIGVYVRQGDYWIDDGGLYWQESHEYAALIKEAAVLWPEERVGFLACSNKPVVPADYPGLTVTPGPGGERSDLVTFSRCDASMGPPSTYTVWTSFTGRGPLDLFHPRERERVGLDNPPLTQDQLREFDMTEERW